MSRTRMITESESNTTIEIAVARGRRAYDKRQAIAERDSKRETERAVGRRTKGFD